MVKYTCHVFFNDNLCLDDMTENVELLKECLRLYEFPDNTPAAIILKHLEKLMDFYVTKTNEAWMRIHRLCKI